ncbi:MAG: LON peptidase substrate-binding domain-containing protein [Spirosomataceae bacterium]
MLALFPLSLVAYPSLPLNLHIFEPRYQELTRRCLEESKPFGIVPYIGDRLMNWGTEMRIVAVEKEYDTGEMDIRTVGTHVFQLLDFVNPMPGHLFAGGQVTYPAAFECHDPKAPNTEIVLNVWERFLDLLGVQMPLVPSSEIPISFQLAPKVGLPLEEEYTLLQIATENHRLAFLANHLQLVVEALEKTSKAKHMISLNGHFKSIDPLKF